MNKSLQCFAVVTMCALMTACVPTASAPSKDTIESLKHMTAVIETNYGTIKFRFHGDEAPNLSTNFVELAKKGYYNGTIFHRVIENFMIQGGDPTGTGSGGTSYLGKGLPDEDGALKLKNNRGAVACAKSSLPNSIGSQFYIVHKDANFLDGNYSVFGYVTEGMDVVDAIATSETDASDRPLKEVKMQRVYIAED